MAESLSVFFPHRSKKCQRKLKFHHNKRECSLQSIIVGGYDNYFQIVEKPNNENEDGDPIIHPPVMLSFDPSSLLSYSAYSFHSILVTSDSSLKDVGYNEDGSISATLQKAFIDYFTYFSIKDKSGRKLDAVSTVYSNWGTFICSQIAAMR